MTLPGATAAACAPAGAAATSRAAATAGNGRRMRIGYGAGSVRSPKQGTGREVVTRIGKSPVPHEMKTCVTGATGFVGGHVAKLLVERGDTVRVTYRDRERLERLA